MKSHCLYANVQDKIKISTGKKGWGYGRGFGEDFYQYALVYNSQRMIHKNYLPHKMVTNSSEIRLKRCTDCTVPWTMLCTGPWTVTGKTCFIYPGTRISSNRCATFAIVSGMRCPGNSVNYCKANLKLKLSQCCCKIDSVLHCAQVLSAVYLLLCFRRINKIYTMLIIYNTLFKCFFFICR